MMKRLEKLEKERDDERKAFAVEKLRSDILKKADDLNVSNKNLWADAVQLVKYSDGMDAVRTSCVLLGNGLCRNAVDRIYGAPKARRMQRRCVMRRKTRAESRFAKKARGGGCPSARVRAHR